MLTTEQFRFRLFVVALAILVLAIMACVLSHESRLRYQQQRIDELQHLTRYNEALIIHLIESTDKPRKEPTQ